MSPMPMNCSTTLGPPWTRLLCPPLSWSLLKFMSIESVYYLTISSSAIPFSFCLRSFPASGSFPMSQFFASGGQNIGASASESVLPKNIQGWFPLELNGLISLQSRELPRVLSSTTIRKHLFFFMIQPFVLCQDMLFNLVNRTMQMYVIISEE